MNNLHYSTPGASGLSTDSMSWSMFPMKTEITQLYEDPEVIDADRRRILSDYSASEPAFEYEQPRRDNWSQGAINLRTHGSRGGERYPWKDDEFDTQFHTADPRGYLQDQNWQLHRKDFESRARLQPWRNDADYSIPETGVRVEDMEAMKKSLFGWIKARLQFTESRDMIASGRGPKRYNTHPATENIDMEDSSATIDTSAANLESLKNVNVILSNNLHLGSRYFHETTTPDQVLPMPSYGYLFRSGGLEKPQSRLRVMDQDRKINPFAASQNTRDIMKFLSGKTGGRIQSQRFANSDKSRYNRILEEEARPQGRVVIKDIMALMGVTENEIKWINSLDNKNKTQQKRMIACVAEMVEGLEKLPPNARLALREELLWDRVKSGIVPKNRGGLSRTVINPKVKEILSAKNKKLKFGERGNHRESFGDPENVLQKIVTSGELYQRKLPRAGSESVVAKEGMRNNFCGRVEGYEDINGVGKFTPCQNAKKIHRAVAGDSFPERPEMEALKKSALRFSDLKTEISGENNFGRELHFDATLKTQDISFGNRMI